MVTHLTLTLSGAAQVLNTALATGQRVGLLKQIILQADGANANVIYVGGTGPAASTAAVSSSAYGFRIEVPVTTVPAAPTIIEAMNTSLADWQVIGTNTQKLHITLITA